MPVRMGEGQRAQGSLGSSCHISASGNRMAWLPEMLLHAWAAARRRTTNVARRSHSACDAGRLVRLSCLRLSAFDQTEPPTNFFGAPAGLRRYKLSGGCLVI